MIAEICKDEGLRDEILQRTGKQNENTLRTHPMKKTSFGSPGHGTALERMTVEKLSPQAGSCAWAVRHLGTGAA